MPAKKLTNQQSGRLGGLASARLLGSEGMRERGIKGAETLTKRYGPEHFTRLAHRRWGRNVSLPSDKEATND